MNFEGEVVSNEPDGNKGVKMTSMFIADNFFGMSLIAEN
jgi:hypothetical protein